MAKLIFYYSVMNAGKSLEILKAAHNYESQGKKVLIMTPAVDNRYGVGKITSRVGVQRDAIIIYDYSNIYKMAKEQDDIKAVIIDEAQFLHKDHIEQCAKVADELDIPVMCYGLKNTYQNTLFEGSRELLIQADNIREVKTVCTEPDCMHKATMILRYENGIPIKEGEVVQIGGDSTYKSVCRMHYNAAFQSK